MRACSSASKARAKRRATGMNRKFSKRSDAAQRWQVPDRIATCTALRSWSSAAADQREGGWSVIGGHRHSISGDGLQGSVETLWNLIQLFIGQPRAKTQPQTRLAPIFWDIHRGEDCTVTGLPGTAGTPTAAGDPHLRQPSHQCSAGYRVVSPSTNQQGNVMGKPMLQIGSQQLHMGTVQQSGKKGVTLPAKPGHRSRRQELLAWVVVRQVRQGRCQPATRATGSVPDGCHPLVRRHLKVLPSRSLVRISRPTPLGPWHLCAESDKRSTPNRLKSNRPWGTNWVASSAG